MNNKRKVSLIIALVVMLSTFTSAFAATGDLTIIEDSKVITFAEWTFDDGLFAKITFASEDYQIEVGEKNYNLDQVMNIMLEGKTLEEAAAQIDAEEELKVVEVSAINGKVTVKISAIEDVERDRFTFYQSINGEEAIEIEAKSVSASDDVYTFSIPKVEQTDVEQSVVISVALDDADAVVADAFIIEAALTVESVSAINNTSTIEVTLGEAVENASFSVTFVDAEEVETAIEVVSATADEDNLVYTVVLEDLDGKKGTLVVNEFELAIDYSATALTTAINLVNAGSTTALNVVERLEQPILNLVNIDEDFAAAYLADIQANLTNTRARLQQAIDRVNTAQTETVQGFIDDLNEALNTADMLTALGNLNIDNVLAGGAFDIAYFDAIEANSTTTVAEIQAVIDGVNLEEVTALVVEAETELTQVAHDAVTAPMLALFEEEVADDFTDRLAAVQETINIEAAIAAVNAEAGAGDAGVGLLAALKDASLELENIVDGNAAAYLTELDALVAADAEFEFVTVADIQTFVDGVNEEVETGLIEAAIAAVNAEAGAGDAGVGLLAALKDASLELENIVDGNAAAYLTELDALVAADATFEFETVAGIQAFVDEVNLAEAIATVNAEVVADVTAANLLTALQDTVLDLDNVSSRNDLVYESELEAIFEDDNTFEFETVADIQAFVDAANATPVGMVNTATTTTAMRTAIENPELNLDLAVYNELSSLQKNLVAMELRDDATSYADADAVQTALETAIANVL